ncbi:hypothetical protein C0993_003631 [Termitomyces sp. T159_Od127]|nr:hypothetical protein C0993_003631 [Termitomyces sp. T159_Od127]
MPRRGGPIVKRNIPNVRRVVAVASGKGGVGKSTIAGAHTRGRFEQDADSGSIVNLAFSLAGLKDARLRVGILDLDVFGPSVPTLMGLQSSGEPELTPAGALRPLVNHGLPTMSMGYLLPRSAESNSTDDTAVVWRGLMVQKAVQQLLFDVDWSAQNGGPLDVLVVDMPPGTGDVPLTLGQLVKVDGAVVVSTPQDVALADVRKGISMFRKVSVPEVVLAMVLRYSIVALALAFSALAQQPIYSQCGGIGWIGGTTCVAGTVCTHINDYYSQCLPGIPTSTTTNVPTTTPATTPTTTATGTSTAPGGAATCSALPSTIALTSNAKLPDPFKFVGGTRTSTKADWDCRREEISQLLQRYELGTLPPKPESITASLSGSRNGKGALVAGAFETRIALTIPQESGSGGAGCWRISDDMLASGIDTQTASEIVQENVWFSPLFNQYTSQVRNLPFDHHMLSALVAPRALLVIDNTSIDWLGPRSVWGCQTTAHEIWKALGVSDSMGVSQVGNHAHCAFPSSEQGDLDAFVNKFLKGQSTNTSILKTDGANNLGYVAANYVDWTTPTLT